MAAGLTAKLMDMSEIATMSLTHGTGTARGGRMALMPQAGTNYRAAT
jgi:hypothetical protein